MLALAACGGDGLLLPSAGQPSRITILGGDGQTATVGQPLDAPFVVRVTDPEGRQVPGVEVVFVAPADAVLAPNDTVETGPDGTAAVHYTLATTAGDQTIEARATAVVPSTSLDTVFHAMAEPEAATSLVLAGRSEQIGEAGAALPESLAVRAVDRFGNGVAGIEVTWEADGGSLSPTSGTTGADGRVATEHILGDRPGVYSATATADLGGSPVTFTATAVAPPSPRLVLVTQPSATASAGVAFSRQPVLQLQDAFGAPLARANVAVSVQIASGDGSLAGRTTARSNAEGIATFTDLAIRGQPGEHTLIFAASDFTSAISNEIDVGAGPPFAGASSASVPANGTAGALTTITIQLKDVFGTPVEDASDDVAVSVGGANPASALEVTDQGDGSYSASYTPNLTGTDQVDVRVNGEAVAGSPFTSVVAAGPADPATTTAVVTRRFQFFFWTIDVVVTTRDSRGNLLGRGGELVQVNGGTIPVQDNGDGTYVTSFNTLAPDQPLTITLNGVPIAGSPYTPQ